MVILSHQPAVSPGATVIQTAGGQWAIAPDDVQTEITIHLGPEARWESQCEAAKKPRIKQTTTMAIRLQRTYPRALPGPALKMFSTNPRRTCPRAQPGHALKMVRAKRVGLRPQVVPTFYARPIQQSRPTRGPTPETPHQGVRPRSRTHG